MSRKIIGITVGSSLPKPNFEQTDPTKGDYIRGDIVAAIPTDTTLSNEGHVADAKAVGDALAEKQPIGDYALQGDLDALGTLVGDTAVSAQISSAVDAVTVESLGAAASDHEHDEYALKSQIPAVPVQSVNGKTGAVNLVATDVGADPTGTANSAVSAHNTATDAHNDIRLLLEGLINRLNTLADSDDTTLDQMSELVAYIKSNKDLIDAITTSKVSVDDIVDNLTTNVANKPLSAAQGVVLKALIDEEITPAQIDAICGVNIYSAEEVEL